MKLSNKLSYIALGGLLMLIGMLASSVFMPSLFAQRDKFGDIECTSLKVDHGSDRYLYLQPGLIRIFDDTLERYLALNPDTIAINSKSWKVIITSGPFLDNQIMIYQKDYEKNSNNIDIRTKIGVDKNGGYVSTHGRSKGTATMGINKYGNGDVSTYDKNGYRQ